MTCTLTRKGSTDAVAVKALKLRLNEVMGSKLDVLNGNFGESTETVVKAFQKSRRLIQDGIVGELTWELLFTVQEKPKTESFSLRHRALEIAETQMHVREKTGNNDGVDVEKYLKSVGLGKGYAYCMALVYWCFHTSSEQLKIPNLVPKTAGVMDCYRKAKAYVVTDPQPGDQFVMDFGKGKGHTGLVKAVKEKTIYTAEGNTSADPSYAGEDREGNGNFYRNRPKSTILAYIRYE